MDLCKPGYDTYITIRVFDKDGSVVPNAEVYVTFLYDGAVFPKRYITSKNITNEAGVAGFRLFNNQQYEANLDCNVGVEVKLYNRTIFKNNRFISLSNLYPNYNLVIDGYKVKMYFIFEDKKVSVDRLILYGDYELNNVYSFEGYVTKEFWGVVVFKDLVRPFNYTLRKDEVFNIFFSKNKYYITVLDDSKTPIECRAILNDIEYIINGTREFELLESSVKGYVNCSNKIEQFSMVEADNRREFIFDVTPPVITDIRAEKVEEDYVLLALSIYDPNQFASGLREVLFYFNNQSISPERVAGSYYYKIPNENGYLKIIAIDKANNIKEVEAYFNKIKTEQKINNTQKIDKKEEDPISWFVLIVGVVVLLGIVYYIYNMYKSVRED